MKVNSSLSCFRTGLLSHRACCTLAVLLLLVGIPVYSYGLSESVKIPEQGFTIVENGQIEVMLKEKGEVQSSSTRSVVSRCEYRTNLVWMIDEGSLVKEGDVIVELDSSLLQQWSQQRQVWLIQSQSILETLTSDLLIQELNYESQLAGAQLRSVLSSLELMAYKLGQASQDRFAVERSLTVANSNLELARRKFDFTKRMVDLGYANASQRDADRLDLMKCELNAENEARRLSLIDRYTFDRKLTELTAKQLEAERALERTKLRISAAKLNGKIRIQAWQRAVNSHQYVFDKINRNIEACTIRAVQDGQVIYAKTSGRSNETLVPGSFIYFQQPLLLLPDRTQLELYVRLHESKIRQVQVGQMARVQVDALPHLNLVGEVVRCGTVPQQGAFPNSDLRDYTVLVKIEADAEVMATLAPGMTGSVNISVAQSDQTPVVSLDSVVVVESQAYVFVKNGELVEERPVQTGICNETRVEVLSGLSVGDEIVSRPRDLLGARIAQLRNQQVQVESLALASK